MSLLLSIGSSLAGLGVVLVIVPWTRWAGARVFLTGLALLVLTGVLRAWPA